MDDVEDVLARVARVAPARLEHEMLLVREAVAMVASGGAPRVVLVGLKFDETALDPARRLALEAGVRLVSLQRADAAGTDIAIESIRA